MDKAWCRPGRSSIWIESIVSRHRRRALRIGVNPALKKIENPEELKFRRNNKNPESKI
jgi:hypothetical protein